MHKNLWSALMIGAAFVAAPVHAQAQQQFQIPGGSLKRALDMYVRQSGVELVYRSDEVSRGRSPGARGQMSREAALSILLAGTGFEHYKDNTGAIAIIPVRAGAVPVALRPVALRPVALQRQAPASHINLAQEKPTEDVGLGEIVVTAQKREESLQDTPISIAVMDGAELEKRGISQFSDLANGAIPSLRIVPGSGGRPSTLDIFMRGVDPGDSSQISRDPTVGLYVDGVYLGRSQGLGAEMLDVERLEVLRGPQGTLFGRNALAGAISLVPKRPTGKLGIDLTAGVGSLDSRKIKAHVNLPEFAGFKVKLDGVLTRRNGWASNPLEGQWDWSQYNRRGGRVNVLWEPSDDIQLSYAYDISRDASSTSYQTISALLPGAAPLPPMFTLDKGRSRTGRTGLEVQPGIGKTWGHSLHGNWDISDEIALRSISSYRKMSQTQHSNTGTMTLPFSPGGRYPRYSYADVHQDQFSQEVQVLGTFERVNFILGGFYFDEDARDLAFAPFLGVFNNDGTAISVTPFSTDLPRFPDRASTVSAKSTAFFAQGTFSPAEFDERLHLTAGLRWTHDRKHGALTKSRGADINVPFTFSSKRVDPAFTLAFDWTENVNTYARWSRAYRAGGANSRSATFRSFGPEELSVWEFGLKSELFDKRLRLNIAAYSSVFKNRQVDFSNPANPSSTETINSDDNTKIKGFEVDLTARVSGNLTLNGSYAFTDWKAAEDTNPLSGVVQTSAVNYTPRHSASIALDHEFRTFQFGTISTHLDAVYSSSFYTQSLGAPKTGSYTMLNGRVTLGDISINSGDAELALSLWGKNLTNEEWEIFQFDFAGPGLSKQRIAAWNEPRTWGVEVRISY